MEFTPVRRVNVSEQIVEQILDRVSSGALVPGDRLPGERKLMENFSVSRSVVREAMRVLHATGVVESRPGDPRGPVVLPFSTDVLRGPLERMAQQEDTSRLELLQFRLVLDGQAALLAAARADEDAVGAVEAAAAGLGELADAEEIGTAAFGERLGGFHDAVRRASGNRLIEVCGAAVGGALTAVARRRLEDETDRSRRVRRSAQDAAHLAGLIRAGESRAASRAATANIFRFYEDTLSPQERSALAPLVLPD